MNFIGNIKVPQPEPTPEEIEQAKIDEYWLNKYQKTKDKELARKNGKRPSGMLFAKRKKQCKSKKKLKNTGKRYKSSVRKICL